MRKAQMVGQVLVLILGAVILITILTYGYLTVNKLLRKQQEVAIAAFEDDLNEAVDRIKLRYGSVEKVDLPIPSKFYLVCIIDSDKSVENEKLKDAKPALYEKWKTTGTNVFMVPGHEFRLENVVVDSLVNGSRHRYCCFETSGRLVIRIEGKGRNAQISEWVEKGKAIQPCTG